MPLRESRKQHRKRSSSTLLLGTRGANEDNGNRKQRNEEEGRPQHSVALPNLMRSTRICFVRRKRDPPADLLFSLHAHMHKRRHSNREKMHAELNSVPRTELRTDCAEIRNLSTLSHAAVPACMQDDGFARALGRLYPLLPAV
jgi:hypothetical protein